MSLSGGGSRRRKRARRATIPVESKKTEKYDVRDYRRAQGRMRSSGRNDKAVLVTAQQFRRARKWGAAGLVCMDPTDFIELTTDNDETAERIRAEAQPLDVYNRLSRAGDIEAPFLDVEIGKKAGRITNHEGRHRAAALERVGGKCLPVAIYPVENRRKVEQPGRKPNPESLLPKRVCHQFSDDPDLCAVPRRARVSKLPRP